MDNLKFVFLDKGLLEWARQLHNDPKVLEVLTDPRVVSKDEQNSWFSSLLKSKTSQRLVVLYNEEPVGIIRLDNIDKHNKSICVGLDIHEDWRGKKLAVSIYQKLFRQLFIEQDFNRLWLMVASYNKRAIALYKKLGFVQEGVHREGLFRNKTFHDYIIMSLLKKEYTA